MVVQPQLIIDQFHHLEKKSRTVWPGSLPSPCPSPEQKLSSAVCFSSFPCSGHFTGMESHGVWPFVSG